MSSKGMQISRASFLMLLALSFSSTSTVASQTTFVQVAMSCGPTSDNKNSGYSAELFGAISGDSIAITRSFQGRGDEPDGFNPMVGYIHKDKLIIKGEGRHENRNKTWKFYFSEKSKGSIKETLLSGVEGKGGSRKCRLMLVREVSSRFALVAKSRFEHLQEENSDISSLNAHLKNEVDRLKYMLDKSDAETTSSVPDNAVQLKTQIDALEDENAKLKAELNVIVQAKAETQPASIDSGKIVALESQITSLEAKLAKANVDLKAARQPSSELLGMAAAISDLQGQLQESDTQLARVRQEGDQRLAALEEELNASRSSLEALKGTIAQKDDDLKNLQVALQTMQSLVPPEPEECEPALQEPAADDLNNPVIAYLEAKTRELEKKLEACATPAATKSHTETTTKKQSDAPQPAASALTEVIFDKQWGMEGVACSQGYNTFHRIFG